MKDVLDILIGMPNVLADEAGLPYQPPNLKDRLTHAIRMARAATSPIAKKEWLDEAQNTLERLVDTSATCHCGTPYNTITGHCDECLYRQEQMTAQRQYAGWLSEQRDEGVPF